MAAASVVTAFVVFFVFMVVVVTFDVRVEYKPACCKRGCRFICAAFYAAVNFDAGFCQYSLCAAADSAANKGISFAVF